MCAEFVLQALQVQQGTKNQKVTSTTDTLIPFSQYHVGITILISHNEVVFTLTRPVARRGQGVQCIRAPFSRGHF